MIINIRKIINTRKAANARKASAGNGGVVMFLRAVFFVAAMAVAPNAVAGHEDAHTEATLDAFILTDSDGDLLARVEYNTTGSPGCSAGVEVTTTRSRIRISRKAGTKTSYTCSGGTRDFSLTLPTGLADGFGFGQVWFPSDTLHTTRISMTVPEQESPFRDSVTLGNAGPDSGGLGGTGVVHDIGIPRTYTVTVTAIPTTAGLPNVVLVYRLTVTVGQGSLAALNSLVLSGDSTGDTMLVPTFESNITTYTASVSGSVDGVTVTPEASDSNAGITVDGTAVDSGMASSKILLTAGEPKEIVVKVTAQDGVASKTYTVTATRRATSDNANLSGLSLSDGAMLMQTFAVNTLTYTASVLNSVSAVTVTPTLSDSSATVTVDGNAPSTAVMLEANVPKEIVVVVTAEDGMTTKTYTVTVTRAASADADLSGLSLSAGTLMPNFDAGEIAYTVSVANSVSEITLTPELSDSNAEVTVDGGAPGTAIPLVATVPKEIVVVVTAQNGMATKTYTVTVTRAASADADLSGLSLSAGTLMPNFEAGKTTYTASVMSNIDKVRVTPVAAESNATVTVDGVALNADGRSNEIALVLSEPKKIVVEVTAQDRTTKTYNVTVTRIPSANADLSGLSLSNNLGLSPDFDPEKIVYTAGAANSIDMITVTPVLSDSNATVTVDGNTVASNAMSGNIQLVANMPKEIVVVVTAQDKTTTKTYRVTVTRALPGDSALAGLTVSGGAALMPTFAADVTSYAANVANNIENVQVTPTANDADAVITVDGNTVASNTLSDAIPLVATVPKTIVVVVTAQDGSSETYRVTVTRMPSSNADLSGLTVSGGAMLSPDFAAEKIDYTASVVSSVDKVRVTPVADESNATITVNGSALGSNGDSDEIMLDLNTPKTIVVVVTAQDGTTKTYNVIVTRTQSDDAALSGISLSAGTLAFASATATYTVTVPNATTSVAITANLNHALAAFTLQAGDAAAAAGVSGTPSPAAEIDEGASLTFTIVVTAENGNAMQTYIVVVTRMPAPPDAPTGLVVTPGKNGFSLDWVAPADTHGAPITGYRVRWGISGESWASGAGGVGDDGAATDSTDATWTLPSSRLSTGATLKYMVAVAAVNSAGIGAWTAAIENNVLNARIPAAPQNFSATVSTTSLTLNWDAVSRADAYKVRWKRDAESAYGSPEDASGTTHMLSGLVASATYDVQVAAVNSDGQGVWTTATFTLTSDPTNANLARLLFNGGAQPLSPPFAVDTTTYAVKVPNRITDVTVTPSAEDANATISVKVGEADAAAVDSGKPSAAGNPAADVDFVFLIVVTSSDSSVTKTYTVTVDRTSLRFATLQAELIFLAGKPLSAVLPAVTGGMSPFTYAVSGLPGHLAFDKDSREISGTAGDTAAQAKITYTVTDAASRSETQEFIIRTVTFDLDLDAAAAATAQDGIITARYLLGVRGAGLVQGQSAADTFTALEAELKKGVDSKALDVDADGNVDGDDGILVARYLLGLRGAALVAEIAGIDVDDAGAIEQNISDLLP